MKILVYGNGWLGNRINEEFGGVVSLSNILDMQFVANEIAEYKPDIVVNAAAKCGKPNIDWCCKPENRAITEAVNAYGPRVLESVCEAHKVKFVHISSGCLWEEASDVKEDLLPDPPSWYSMTKAMAETTLNHNRTLILRPRMPIDGRLGDRNLISKLSKYDKVLDIHNSVSVVEDFLSAMKALMEKDCTGIYHVANPGWVTAREVMELYCEIVDPSHCFQIVDMDYLWKNKLISDGRSNVVLNTDKLNAEGIELPDAKQRVRECVEKYAEHIEEEKCRLNTSQEAG